MADSKQTANKSTRKPITARTIGLLIMPLLLLVAMIMIFLNTNAGLDFEVPAPIEDLNVERVILTRNRIEVVLRNTGPDPITIAQIAINDGIRLFTMDPGNTIPRLSTATLETDYGWVEGEAYGIRLFTTNAIAFDVDIPIAFETPAPDASNILGFFLIGLYVGVIPVFLGVTWLPALRRLHRKWMTILLAITVGLLIFLGIDTLVEAIDQAAEVPGPFQGIGLVAIGAVGVFLLLRGLSQQEQSVERNEAERRLSVAYLIALGIGLHNLGEGLAIGAAYNVGEISLGTFLVVGFIIQNITEGLGIIAPVLRDQTRLRDLFYLGLLGGAPAILGAWLGGFSPSPILAVLFLGVGTGAIFEVAYEIGLMLQKDKEAKKSPYAIFAGVFAGMLILWVTGLIIK